MTREYWNEIKKKKEANQPIPLEIFFEYYLEKGGFIKDFNGFKDVFLQIVDMNPVNVKGRLMRVTSVGAFEKIYTHYENQFNYGK